MGRPDDHSSEQDSAPAGVRDNLGPAGLVLVGITSVQFGAALATTLFDELGPLGAVFLRTAFAALIIGLIWRPGRRLLRGSSARDVVLFGLVLTGMNGAFYVALDRLPLGIAVTIEFIGPLTVAALGSRRRSDLGFVALAVVGVLLLSPGIGNGLDPVGVLFALIAAFFWGVYIHVASRVGQSAGQVGLATAMLISAVLLLPAGVAQAGVDLLDLRLLAIGAAVGLLASAIPYVVELEALKRLSPGAFGVLMSLEPAVAALAGAVALDQGLLTREVIAIGLVVIAGAGALRHAPIAEPDV